MTRGLITQARLEIRDLIRTLHQVDSAKRTQLHAGHPLYFFKMFLSFIQSQVKRLEKQFTLLHTCFHYKNSHCFQNEIFPTDDSEHEWILQTCRKAAGDEVIVEKLEETSTMK